MSSTERTIACPICGEPYVFYMFSAADQSACPDCVAKAREPRKGNRFEWVTEIFVKEGDAK